MFTLYTVYIYNRRGFDPNLLKFSYTVNVPMLQEGCPLQISQMLDLDKETHYFLLYLEDIHRCLFKYHSLFDIHYCGSAVMASSQTQNL